MRYALYVRKSTEEDERQAQSIADQQQRGVEFARHKGLSEPVLFAESRSAKDEGRTEFNRMLALIDQGELDGVLAWHPDRLSRNEMDAAALTMRVRKGILKELHFVNYYFHNSPEGMMMLQIALSQSQYFSSKLAGDVKRGMESKVKKGWFPHRAPAGYRNDKHLEKGSKTISPDPIRFPLIRRAFDCLLSEGYAPLHILHLLNEEWGYRSPITRAGGDKPLSNTGLYNLFANRFYAGFFVHNGQLHEGKHTPMITLDEWKRVQTILGRSERVQPKSHDFPYTGLIHCARCEGLITAQITTNRQGKGYAYYRCQSCKGQLVSERELQSQIDAEVDRVDVAEADFQKWAEATVRRFVQEERPSEQAVYTQKLTTLAALDGQLDNLLTILTKGLITDAEYTTRKVRLQEERVLLHREVDSAIVQADQAREAMENLILFLSNVKAWMALDDAALKRACVRALGSNFRLEGKKVVWEPHPLLVKVRAEYPELQARYRQIKHDETLSESAKHAHLEAVQTAWSRIWGHNQTFAMQQQFAFPDLRQMGKAALPA